jgi:hypothetical protein
MLEYLRGSMQRSLRLCDAVRCLESGDLIKTFYLKSRLHAVPDVQPGFGLVRWGKIDYNSLQCSTEQSIKNYFSNTFVHRQSLRCFQITFETTMQKMTSQPQQRDPLLYEPLQTSSRQLRLLTLGPSTNLVEALRCSLVRASLDSNPNYEAISYTWG